MHNSVIPDRSSFFFPLKLDLAGARQDSNIKTRSLASGLGDLRPAGRGGKVEKKSLGKKVSRVSGAPFGNAGLAEKNGRRPAIEK